MFGLIYFLTAGFAVWIKYYKFDLYKFAKPVPLTILLLSALSFSDARFFFVLFLLFSLAGDVFLLGVSRKAFVAGLASFLLAHIFLIIELWRRGAEIYVSVLMFTAAVSFGYYLFVLKSRLGKMKFPVIVYLSVISVMVILSAGVSGISSLLFVGAVLFYLSDAILAYGKFVRKPKLTDLFSLSAYYTGQFLIFAGLQGGVIF